MKRNLQLDAMRGIAVLAVMLHHIAPSFLSALPLAWGGVRFFFVISGFLITGILLKAKDLIVEGEQSVGFALKQFYFKRVLRIFPIFYLSLAVLALFNAGQVRDYLLWHLTYLSNFRFIQDGYFHNYVSHFWTLAVEEQFYLVWPAVVLFVPRRYLIPVILLCVGAGITYRYVAVTYLFNPVACEAHPLACVDTLAAGSLLAVLFRECKTTPKWYMLYAIFGWIGGISIIADILLTHDWLNVQRFMFMPVAMSLFSIGMISRATTGYTGIGRVILEFKPLVYIGTISYGLYVYHAIVQSFLVQAGFKPYQGGQIALSLGLSLLLAVLSWHFFEKPINSLKRLLPTKEGKPVRIGGHAMEVA